jgi:hypothetical protein
MHENSLYKGYLPLMKGPWKGQEMFFFHIGKFEYMRDKKEGYFYEAKKEFSLKIFMMANQLL